MRNCALVAVRGLVMLTLRRVGFLNERREILDLKWFTHDAVRAERQCSGGEFGRAVRSHQNNLNLGRLAFDRGEQAEIIGIGQAIVKQDDIGTIVGACHNPKRFLGIARFRHHVPPLGQRLSQRPPNERLVINDQYVGNRGILRRWWEKSHGAPYCHLKHRGFRPLFVTSDIDTS